VDNRGWMLSQGWPRCVHLAGVDGSGKTTQARAIMALLEAQGVRARYVWLRFPHLFCAPLLAYARLRGFSHREMLDGHQHGYWDFASSRLMSRLFPWLLLVDTFLVALFRIYWPLMLGYKLVCDRFAVDVLVDLMAGLGDSQFDRRLPGRLYLALLPHDTRVVVLDLDTQTAQRRSSRLRGDRSHGQRRQLYLEIARRNHFCVVPSAASIPDTAGRLLEALDGTSM
jgi:thymidylate kinase